MAALLGTAAGLALAWLAVEVGLRVALARPLATDFYGSIPRDAVRAEQTRCGVRVADGIGWSHLGWIADPASERYRVERRGPDGSWHEVARVRLGSCLVREAGPHRVWAVPRGGGAPRLLGSVEARPAPGRAPLQRPRIAGPWRPLFRPARHGTYVNDHVLFRDAAGRFRLLGITGPGKGDYRRERWLAQGVCETFPPADGMREDERVADHGALAWAPWVVEHAGTWHLFWSPHRLEHATSPDGVRWSAPRTALRSPVHPFFRDAMVREVAPGQWLLYATGRGRWLSRIDAYQSFDLERWQYIGPALRCRPGSERNAAYASTETPTVVEHEGRFYLSFTYDNGSRPWHALRLALRRRSPTSYDETLVIASDNPYRFGDYRGRRRTPSLVAELRAHAPRLFRHPETGAWWITTAGWPWAASLTRGEVAVAPLAWESAEGSAPTAARGASLSLA